MAPKGKIKTQITDKNGKITYVWKNPDEVSGGKRSAGSVTPTASATSVRDSDAEATLSEESKSQGWNHNITLKNVWNNDDMSIAEKGTFMAARIRGSEWYAGHRKTADGSEFELEAALDELEVAGAANDVEAFDEAWSNIYDLSDADRVQIVT